MNQQHETCVNKIKFVIIKKGNQKTNVKLKPINTIISDLNIITCLCTKKKIQIALQMYIKFGVGRRNILSSCMTLNFGVFSTTNIKCKEIKDAITW